MPATNTLTPENHSRGLEIVRAISALRGRTKDLPSWGGNNRVGVTTPFSTAWNNGAQAIADEFGLTPNEFLAFVRFHDGRA